MIPGVGHDYVHVATAATVTAFIVVLSVLGRMALGNGDAAIEPAGKLSLKGFFEVIVEWSLSVCTLFF